MVISGALVGSALGFIASITPDIIALLREHFVHKRAMCARQQELETVKAGYQIISAQSEQIADLTNRLSTAENTDDNQFIAILRASVRPCLTYAFFALFAFVKLRLMYYAFAVNHATAAQLLPVLWDDETETLFSAVISFWFGTRAFTKVKSYGEAAATTTTTIRSGNLSGTARIVGE